MAFLPAITPSTSSLYISPLGPAPTPLYDLASESQRPLADSDTPPLPPSPHNRKGKARRYDSWVSVERRATATGPVAAGYPDCTIVGNSVETCWPLGNTTVEQGTWSKLIWNVNLPSFIGGQNEVDVHLFLADNDALITSWFGLPTPEGQLAFTPNDTWWSSMARGNSLPASGHRLWPTYFVVVPAGRDLVGTEEHQSTFTANQTALPTSVSLSMLSVSSTASVALAPFATISMSSMSRISVSSVSVASTASIIAAGGTPYPGGSLQGNGGGDGFPKWATALLSVLGALLLFSILALVYLLVRRLQRRDHGEHVRQGSNDSFSSPMVEQRPHLGLSTTGLGLAGATAGTALGAVAASDHNQDRDRPFSPASPQTTVSSHHQHAPQQPPSNPSMIYGAAGNTGAPSSIGGHSLSGADAASISAAYRSALSNPVFAATPPEGSTPPEETPKSDEALQRALEREGVVMKGVGARGVQVRD